MHEQFEQISVIGLGYIGLPTAAVIAGHAINVLGIDVNERAVGLINEGKIHIEEPGLEAMVRGVVDNGHLRAATTPEASDAFLVAVPTPFKEDHQPDLSYIEAAAKSIAAVLKKGDLVVLESTSPVGATEQMAGWLAEARSDLSFPQDAGEKADVQVAHCPERVLPGRVLIELIENDRVIGGMTPHCAKRAADLYKSFVQGDCVITNARTAEMAKLTENASRDVSIAFANELSLICDQLDIDVWELIALANRHPRVNILNPGPGVGGHCIAVDPWFIISKTPEQARMIRAARDINDGKPHYVVKQVRDVLAGNEAPVIAVLGLAFKPDIDDLRESPAVEIAQELTTLPGAQVLAVEPYVKELPAQFDGISNIELTDVYSAVAKADVVVLLVDHRQFRGMSNPAESGKVVIDTRGAWR